MPDATALCPGCFQAERPEKGACARCGYQWDPGAFRNALTPGTLLRDQFLVGRVLGTPGGFGITYLAFDTVLERRLAVKELMPRMLVARETDQRTVQVQTSGDEKRYEDTLASFLDEARTVARFDHPNIVRILHFFEENGTAYFTMDYYEGRGLDAVRREAGGRLPWRRAVDLMVPVLRALDVVHAQSVLHRDLKPSNIYLADGDRPILLDFGTARVALAGQTRTLTAYHSPGYTPPEQLFAGRQGPWTDVYGAAATLYSLIAGEPPADPLRPGHSAPSLATLVPEVPARVSDAIDRALTHEAAGRPQGALAFAALLGADVAAPGAAGPTEVWVPGVEAGGDDATELADPDLTELADGDLTELAPPPSRPALPANASSAQPALQDGSPIPSGSRRWTPAVWLAGVAVLAVSGLALAWGGGADPAPSAEVQPFLRAPDTAVGARGDEARPRVSEAEVDGGAQQAPNPSGPSAQAAPESGTPPPSAPVAAAPSSRESTAAEPSAPDPSAPDPPATGVAVLVYGDPAAPVEGAILGELLGASGLRGLDPGGVALLRGLADPMAGGSLSAFGEEARRRGAAYVVVGTLDASAAPQAVGRRYAGEASLTVTLYALTDGRVLGSETFRVGMGGEGRSPVAMSEAAARSMAAERVARIAAQRLAGWIPRDP